MKPCTYYSEISSLQCDNQLAIHCMYHMGRPTQEIYMTCNLESKSQAGMVKRKLLLEVKEIKSQSIQNLEGLIVSLIVSPSMNGKKLTLKGAQKISLEKRSYRYC